MKTQRDSIRVPVWQWRLQGGRLPVKLKDGTHLNLTDQPISAWYNEARDALRKQLPGDQIYHKRDYFQRLPDHVLGNYSLLKSHFTVLQFQ